MTIDTEPLEDFTIDRLVRGAYRLAGLMNAGEELSVTQGAAGRENLELILCDLEAEGYTARKVAFETITTVAGTASYALSGWALECVGQGMYADSSGTETPVSPMNRETYQGLVDKDTPGRSTLYWCNRTVDPIQVTLYPVPTESTTIRFQVLQLRASALNGANTLDAERYFFNYLRFELAHQLSLEGSVNLARSQYLAMEAGKRKQRCLGAAKQNIMQQIIYDHRGPYT